MTITGRLGRRIAIVVIGLVLTHVGQASAGKDPHAELTCQVTKLAASSNRAACIATAQGNAGGSGSTLAFLLKGCESGFDREIADADVEAQELGVTCRFIDNGDGTVSDLDTLLMWQKLNDNDAVYRWSDAMTTYLVTLNGSPGDIFGGKKRGFAGYEDWRVPNNVELLTIAECKGSGDCIDPVFETGSCSKGCDVRTCACTASTGYWTSVFTSGGNPIVVDFRTGDSSALSLADRRPVRAVRGGRLLQ